MIVPDSLAVATPVEPDSRSLLALRSIRATSLDVTAAISSVLKLFRDSRQADALHDQSLTLAGRAAAVGAQEAEIRRCGCAQRFDRVVTLVSKAQQHDADEDRFLDRAQKLIERAMGWLRNLTGAADRLATEKPR